ncbi:Hsp20/alpha crystallin family protein [Desulfobacula sp.]|jgi:HSP20 family protein
MNDIERLFGTMDLLRKKLEKSNPEFSIPFGYNWTIEESIPRTNIHENGDNFEVRAEVPGISKEDLKVKVQGNYLEISGLRKPDEFEGFKKHKTERNSKSFSRSFTLPAEVDTGEVKATLKNGILFLTLPKSEAAKPKRVVIS